MKRMIMLICLLLGMVSLCACNSVEPPPPPETSVDLPDRIQENSETQIEETEPQMLGEYTVDDLAKKDGFFVKYSDGSFDRYHSGTVLNWGQPEYYTYGTEWFPANVVLSAENDALNVEKMKSGTLVFKTSHNAKVEAGVYPVIESGFAMRGKNTNGDSETLFWFDETGNDFWVVDGTKIEPQYRWNFSRLRDVISINGMTPGSASIFEKEDDKMYVTLQLGDTYIIGEADGTALIESEYIVNQKYYLSTLNFNEEAYHYSEDYSSLELQPTADGYAVVDLSEIPAGDYIITYSYWNEEYEKRWAYTTHICIE